MHFALTVKSLPNRKIQRIGNYCRSALPHATHEHCSPIHRSTPCGLPHSQWCKRSTGMSPGFQKNESVAGSALSKLLMSNRHGLWATDHAFRHGSCLSREQQTTTISFWCAIADVGGKAVHYFVRIERVFKIYWL